jgi:hypothetical protein
MAAIFVPRPLISSWDTPSFRYTETSTFWAQSPVISRTCRSTSSEPPRRNREMKTVEMAAKVTSGFRRSAVPVSRKK